jgi:hypothetical protein
MKRYVQQLMAKLRGGEITDALLWDVEEALRMARMRGYQALAPELNEQGITEAERKRLRQAAYAASRSYLAPAARLPLLLICVRDGDRRVIPEIEGEIARLAMTVRQVGASLYQALIALHDAGIDIYPASVTSMGIDSYDDNMNAATKYLGKRGLLGRTLQAIHKKRRAG